MVDKTRIQIKMEPKDIVYMDNIMEGYDGLCIVTTEPSGTGEVTLHVTPDTYDTVMEILQTFPKSVLITQIS